MNLFQIPHLSQRLLQSVAKSVEVAIFNEMKVSLLFLLVPAMALAQPKLDSKTYPWPQNTNGRTTLLQNLEIRTSNNDGTHTPHLGQEELIIIREGALVVTMHDRQERLETGSIIYIMAGDQHVLAPISKTPCKYYVIKFGQAHLHTANEPGSFTVDWNRVEFVPHEKGGRRNMCDGRTGMFERFEMHVTTLNAGLQSHDPHSHTPEEIILVKEGDIEMTLGDQKVKASKGDLVLIDSKIMHGLTNIGTTPATYFAFQWN